MWHIQELHFSNHFLSVLIIFIIMTLNIYRQRSDGRHPVVFFSMASFPADSCSPSQTVDGEVETAVEHQQQVRDLKQSWNYLKQTNICCIFRLTFGSRKLLYILILHLWSSGNKRQNVRYLMISGILSLTKSSTSQKWYGLVRNICHKGLRQWYYTYFLKNQKSVFSTMRCSLNILFLWP